MYSKIGVIRLYNGHVFFVITRQSNPPISTFSTSCNTFTSVWLCSHAIFYTNVFFFIYWVLKNMLEDGYEHGCAFNPILYALSVIRSTILITIVEQGQVPFTLELFKC